MFAFFGIRIIKNCMNLMFWRLGTMLERVFIAKSFGLHIWKPKKIPRNIFFDISNVRKVNPQGPFGQTKLYFEPEKRPAGAFGADTVSFWARKASRRGLLGKIFHKLRIQGRVQIFEKKSQKALSHVFIGSNARSRCADFAGIFIIVKVLSASSYGHFPAAKEFWSQCHIFRFGNNKGSSRRGLLTTWV